MLFKRELLQDNSDFVVEVLIDASGSQQRRQSLVALQGFIISRALSLAQIPHRVTGFCTFGSYTILNEYRDYLDNSDADENIFEFYGLPTIETDLLFELLRTALINSHRKIKF